MIKRMMVIIGVAWAVAACTTTQERVTGAGAGAVVGSVAGPAGAAVGAVGGAIVGPSVSNATVDQPTRRKKRYRH
jgi:osmotically inducible lipoprotein OsmB